MELFKKAILDCKTRCARKEACAPVSRLQSHTLRGSTVALFEQKTIVRRACRSVVVRSMEQVAV